jgi:2-polyprenyl-6-methoxyphenol hydroxylase-like FAD-dependent oxidoreductase
VRAIVIGAGIGGLATAIGLRRIGWDVTVCERAAEMAHIRVGSAMQIAPNGMRALRALDPKLEQDVEAAGAQIDYVDWLDRRGRMLAIWPIEEWAQDTGAHSIGIARSELQRVLSEVLETDAVAMNRSFESFDQDRSGVTVRFADGADERADVLIGADGLRSGVRDQLLGPSELRVLDYVSFQALVRPERELMPRGRFLHFVGRGERFVALPVDAETTCWVAHINASRIQGGDGELPLADVIARFRDWPSPARALIDATPEGAARRMENYDRKPVKRWGEGRVSLLGDAIHPMASFGQGANQAIEDALVLTSSLEREADVTAGLRMYESARLKPTRSMVRTAKTMTTMLHWENAVACTLRDWLGIRVGFRTVVPPKQKALFVHELVREGLRGQTQRPVVPMDPMS